MLDRKTGRRLLKTLMEQDVEFLISFGRELKRREALNLKLLNCSEPKRHNSI